MARNNSVYAITGTSHGNLAAPAAPRGGSHGTNGSPRFPAVGPRPWFSRKIHLRVNGKLERKFVTPNGKTVPAIPRPCPWRGLRKNHFPAFPAIIFGIFPVYSIPCGCLRVLFCDFLLCMFVRSYFRVFVSFCGFPRFLDDERTRRAENRPPAGKPVPCGSQRTSFRRNRLSAFPLDSPRLIPVYSLPCGSMQALFRYLVLCFRLLGAIARRLMPCFDAKKGKRVYLPAVRAAQSTSNKCATATVE